MKKLLLSLAVVAMAAGCSLVDEGGVPAGKKILRVTSDEGTRTEIVTDDEVTEVIRKVVDETNRSVPTYKRIVQFTIRKTEFIKTTTAKIQRFRKENREKE